MKAARYLAGEGWPAALSRAWQAAAGWVCSSRRQVILEWRPGQAVSPGELTALEELTSESRDELERVMYHPPGEIQRRFQRGDRCFGIRDRGRLVHYSWVSFAEPELSSCGRRLRLEPGEAYIYNCRTERSHRGRGIFRTVLRQIGARLRGEGFGRVLISIAADNSPSLAAAAGAEFQPAGDVMVTTRLGRRALEATPQEWAGRLQPVGRGLPSPPNRAGNPPPTAPVARPPERGLLSPPNGAGDPGIEITVGGDGLPAGWDGFVESEPSCSIYHDGRWLAALSRLGPQPLYLLARQGGEPVGALPVMIVTSRLVGRAAVSLPYYMGGVAARSPQVAEALVASASQQAGRAGAHYLELRQPAACHWGNPCSSAHKASLRLSLAPGADALWKGFRKQIRNRARRAEGEGITVAHGGQELLDEFYHAFCQAMRDLGSPVYGRDFFRAILQAFGDDAAVWLARVGGEPASAKLVLYGRGGVHLLWGANLRRWREIGVNYLLTWKVIEDACQRGLEYLDFGRSTIGSGPWQFKRQWGGEEQPLYWQWWGRGGSLNRESRLAQPAIRVWRRLPLCVANRLGPWVAKQIP